MRANVRPNVVSRFRAEFGLITGHQGPWTRAPPLAYNANSITCNGEVDVAVHAVAELGEEGDAVTRNRSPHIDVPSPLFLCSSAFPPKPEHTRPTSANQQPNANPEMTGPPKTSGTGPGQPAIASALAAAAQHQQRASRTASPSSQVDMTSNDPVSVLPTATSGGNAGLNLNLNLILLLLLLLHCLLFLICRNHHCDQRPQPPLRPAPGLASAPAPAAAAKAPPPATGTLSQPTPETILTPTPKPKLPRCPLKKPGSSLKTQAAQH
ncbi:hypothetical protein CAOG_008377 [Capsaspora owczarzaki ATCC 30864]|uniref:Uncharacterized protein n=1 Tax=Capsaspora owczarzaki (strain ATCC 30864) TaxID=595528 RepID=A0A0D2UTY5_CAPO3|nr:hypothetical protein CAOG_008377 [Capsaspora owczarzaki ATCC 30864]